MAVEVFIAAEMDLLRGRVLGLIESWGLPDKQEAGCKAIFKSLTYDSQARLIELVKKPATGG